jgi:hypothetical protein
MELAHTLLRRATVVGPGRFAGLLSITDLSRVLELQRGRVSGFPRSGSGVSTVTARRVAA